MDIRIKRGVLTDALKLLALNIERKRQYKADRDRKLKERLEKPRAVVDDKDPAARANVADEERKFK